MNIRVVPKRIVNLKEYWIIHVVIFENIINNVYAC
jgi:hypothetical protein